MIEPMMHYTFVLYGGDKETFIDELKRVGVVQVSRKADAAASEDFVQLAEREKRLKGMLRRLETMAGGQEESPRMQRENPQELMAEYEALEQEETDCRQACERLKKEMERIAPWGAFDTGDVTKKWAAAGRKLRFCQCPTRLYNPKWAEEHDLVVIADKGAVRYFVVVEREDETADIDAEEVTLPATSYAMLEAQSRETERHQAELGKRFETYARQRVKAFRNVLAQTQEQMERCVVQGSATTAAEDALCVFEGWCPSAKTDLLDKALAEQPVYTLARKPQEGEAVPVLLRNNRFARLYEIIGRLYDTPNYEEIDLTPFFAPFYMLFFGLCLGDAGYGLVLLLGGLIARRRVTKEPLRSVLSLVAILGASTVVMGIVSGTFFGISLLGVEWAWMEKFKKIMLDSSQLFYVALGIGVVQILFGMLIRAIGQVRRYGWAASLAQWGWLLIFGGCGGVWGASMMQWISPETARYGYLAAGIPGAVCIFLLNNIHRSPLINIGSGLWNSYNMLTGFLGDVLSYIRLFALGISGAVMGFVFNDLAINLSGNIPVVSQIVMLLILVVGHGINIFMSGLSAFVHPMRLTFVEFYKNAGFEGGGKPYAPFARKDEN